MPSQELIKPFGYTSPARAQTAPNGARRRAIKNDFMEYVNPPPQYPYCYQPEQAFQSLQDKSQGHGNSVHDRAVKSRSEKRDYHIPGYTGYVRGSQHIAGRTYGEATRKAMTTSYRENLCTSPIPSGPQTNGRVPHVQNPNSFVSKVFAGKQYHVPGYTGFVPGVKAHFSRTYGSATGAALSKKGPKTRGLGTREGYASAMRNRELLVVAPAPLPGMMNPVGPPRKMVPGFVGQLQFMGN